MLPACSRRAGDRHSVGIDLERECALGLVDGNGGIPRDDGECVGVIRSRLAAEDAGGVIQRNAGRQCAAGFERESVRRLGSLDLESLRVGFEFLAVGEFFWRDPRDDELLDLNGDIFGDGLIAAIHEPDDHGVVANSRVYTAGAGRQVA